MLYKKGKQVKHIYKKSYNLLDIMQEGWKSGVYDYIDLPLDPNKTYMLLIDYNKASKKDNPLTVGFTFAVATHNYVENVGFGPEWFGFFGRSNSNSLNPVKVTLPANGYKKQLYCYKKNSNWATQQEWADAIEKLFGHIWIVEGTTSKPYLPYLIDVSKVYKNSVCVFSNIKALESNNILTLNNTTVNNTTATLKGENITVNKNELIIE